MKKNIPGINDQTEEGCKLVEQDCKLDESDTLDPEMSLQSVNFAPKENSLLNEYGGEASIEEDI